MDAVDDAPEIDVERAPPGFVFLPRPGAAVDRRVVHQHAALAEFAIGDVLEPADLLHPGDIGGHGERPRARLRGERTDRARGGVERRAWQIGEAEIEAARREALGGGESDAARGAGNDGAAAGGDGWVIGHGSYSFRLGHASGDTD